MELFRRFSLEDWQREAADAFKTENERPAAVVYEVMKRTAETASAQLEVCPAPENDHTACWLDAPPNSPEDPQKKRKLFFSAGRRPLMSDMDGATVQMDFFSGITTMATIIDCIEKREPPLVGKEYNENMEFLSHLQHLASMLFHFFEGGEMRELAETLFDFSERHRDIILVSRGGGEMVPMRDNLETHVMAHEDFFKTLRWALGEQFFAKLTMRRKYEGLHRIFEKFYDFCLDDRISEKTARKILHMPNEAKWQLCQPQEILENLWKLFRTKRGLRQKFLELLKQIPREPERFFTSGLVRQGWRTLAETNAVSPREWWESVEIGIAETESPMENHESRFTSEYAVQLKTRLAEVRAAGVPVSSEVKKLKDVIDCERYRKELAELYEQSNSHGIETKEREIIARVMTEVTKFIAIQKKSDEESEPFERGFPVHVADKKETSCFSAPWLVAALLLECGLHDKMMLYAHVNQEMNGLIGGHGSLIFQTRRGNWLLLDPNFSHYGSDILFPSDRRNEITNEMIDLMTGERKNPLTVSFSSEEAEEYRLHRHMQIMPVQAGFGSGHLEHVGISFFKEGKLEEAKYAFELALNFFPEDADAYYYLGLVHSQKGNEEEALSYFVKALDIFPEHVRSDFAIGEVFMKRAMDSLRNGKEDSNASSIAIGAFATVAFNPNPIYGTERSLQERAKKLIGELRKRSSRVSAGRIDAL